ncbi:MAG: hypothetical protein DRP63_04400 [Planctomycetota bacterium]|nr:MAG: hypothetical protein DRP63_04400 [Planctomycetota bacterium]
MRWVVTAVVAFLFCSCKSVPKPPIDVRGKRLLVLPFAYKGYHFGQHPLGAELARLVCGVVAARVKGVVLCDAEPFAEMFSGKASDKVDWRRLAFAANADFVLAAKIHDFRDRNPLDVNLYQGVMQVEAWVYDREGRRRITRLVDARYPYRHPDFAAATVFGLSRDEVVRKTKERAAVLIARLLYTPNKGEE